MANRRDGGRRDESEFWPWTPEWKADTDLSVVDRMHRILETYSFASNLSSTVAGDDVMHVRLRFGNLAGRALVVDWHRIHFGSPRRTDMPSWEIATEYQRLELANRLQAVRACHGGRATASSGGWDEPDLRGQGIEQARRARGGARHRGRRLPRGLRDRRDARFRNAKAHATRNSLRAVASIEAPSSDCEVVGYVRDGAHSLASHERYGKAASQQRRSAAAGPCRPRSESGRPRSRRRWRCECRRTRARMARSARRQSERCRVRDGAPCRPRHR